jgi:hypothetical protein
VAETTKRCIMIIRSSTTSATGFDPWLARAASWTAIAAAQLSARTPAILSERNPANRPRIPPLSLLYGTSDASKTSPEFSQARSLFAEEEQI